MIKRHARQVFTLVAAGLIGIAFAEDPAATATDAGAAAASGTPAEAVQLKSDYPRVYTVQPGDTLWGISEKFLQNPWQWPELWHINEQVANPHLIYPGNVLRMSWRDGRPVLSLEGGPEAGGQPGDGNLGASAIVEMVDAETVKLKPRIRELPVSAAIPAIPLKNIESFLVSSRVVTRDELKKAPYVVAGEEQRLVMGAGDSLYARDIVGRWGDASPEYGFYRGGKDFVDPVTSEYLGTEAMRLGAGRVIARDGEVATLRVLKSEGDIRIEDRVLYDDQRRIQSMFNPRPAPDNLSGRILHIFGTLGTGARNDVIVVNRGTREDIQPGHVMSILQNSGTTRDRAQGDIVALPPSRVGLAIVFRSFEKVSYALVTRSSRAIKVGDQVSRPRIDMD